MNLKKIVLAAVARWHSQQRAVPNSPPADMGIQKAHTHYGNRWRVVEL